jgi:hypothetical protein
MASDSDNVRKLWKQFENIGKEVLKENEFDMDGSFKFKQRRQALNTQVVGDEDHFGEWVEYIGDNPDYEGQHMKVTDMNSVKKLIGGAPNDFEYITKQELVQNVGVVDPASSPMLDDAAIDHYLQTGELNPFWPEDFDESQTMETTFAGRTTPTFGRKGVVGSSQPNPMFDDAVTSFENWIIMNGTQNRNSGVQFAAREHGIDPTDLKMELIKRRAFDMNVPSRELRDSADQELKSFKQHLEEVLAQGKK